MYTHFMQALTSPSQRRDLLQELFADIALEVDDRAQREKKILELSSFNMLLSLL